MNIEVSSLRYHPIKSCAEVVANELEVVETGFKHDREWMVVDENGKFLSQRTDPKMALIQPEIYNGYLQVEAPGMSLMPMLTDLHDREEIDVIIHKKPAKGLVMGGEVAAWFSQYLQKDVQLVQVPPKSRREINGRYHYVETTNKVGFADSYSFLLTSEASLGELNAHLNESVLMNRFRPNIVVNGDDLEAYEEDTWRELRIGELRAFVVRACERCPIPDTDQATGVRAKERAVTAALRATRHGVDLTDPDQKQGNFFGQNLNHVYEPGEVIRVGDQVQIFDRATEPNIRLL